MAASPRPAQTVLRNPNPECYEALAPYYREIYGLVDAEETVRQWLELLRTLEAYRATRSRHLVDIGCGPGWHLKAWLDRGFQASGIDASPSLLKMASRHLGEIGSRVQLHRTNVLEPDGLAECDQFDVAVSHFNFLNLFPDTERRLLFRSVARLVRPEGLWLADFTEPSQPPAGIEEEIPTLKGALHRTGIFDPETNRYRQTWAGLGVACEENYWFGHLNTAEDLMSDTGWTLLKRVAWTPAVPQRPWTAPTQGSERFVDVYQRGGR